MRSVSEIDAAMSDDDMNKVHERTIESDFLLIVLKSLLAQRSDLKYVYVSHCRTVILIF